MGLADACGRLSGRTDRSVEPKGSRNPASGAHPPLAVQLAGNCGGRSSDEYNYAPACTSAAISFTASTAASTCARSFIGPTLNRTVPRSPVPNCWWISGAQCSPVRAAML